MFQMAPATRKMRLRTVGDIPSFAFEIEDHLTIGERLDIIDVNAAAKVSGSRFTYLKGGRGAFADGACTMLSMFLFRRDLFRR